MSTYRTVHVMHCSTKIMTTNHNSTVLKKKKNHE